MQYILFYPKGSKSKYTTTRTQREETQTISEHLQSQSMASPYFTSQDFPFTFILGFYAGIIGQLHEQMLT